ncbi:right-handed parallel beta-helix repeat-containing protein [Halorussus sp. AFM4]|uniref:right-handed parallel beta-helix repeat-containing protein n=1 Tax=Halorussus sp. AFM4 TaxID=3421651 RepID=UPI003EBEFCB0
MNRATGRVAAALVVGALLVASVAAAISPGVAGDPASAAPDGAEPDGDVAEQVLAEGRPAVPVEGCTVIAEPGRYVLTRDVTNPRVETCIAVRADDVTLDGAGHAVDGGRLGQATAGVSVAPGAANVTVRDLTVSRWAFGIRYDGVTGGEIANVTARFAADGIHVRDSRDVVVRSATAEHNFVGVAVGRSERVAVADTAARWNAIHGVSLAAATDVALSNVTAASNEVGLGVFRAVDVAGRDVTAVSNRMTGVELTGVAEGRVANATVRGGAGEAFVRTPRGFVAVDAIDVALARTRDSRVGSLAVGPDWSVSLGARTVNTSVTVLADGTEAVSLSGSGVVVSSAAAPPPPPDREALGPAVRAEATAPDATLALAVEYADVALGVEDVAEATLGLWRYDGGEWAPVAGGRADADRNLVRATVTDFSVFAVLGERTAAVGDATPSDSAAINGSGATGGPGSSDEPDPSM